MIFEYFGSHVYFGYHIDMSAYYYNHSDPTTYFEVTETFPIPMPCVSKVGAFKDNINAEIVYCIKRTRKLSRAL